jgi:CRP-like cAMP-binding protein
MERTLKTAARGDFDPQAFLAKVGEGRTVLAFRKNEIVFSQGDVADKVFYIQKGKVKVVVMSEQGKEAVVAIFEPGQFFGEGCLIGNAERVSTTTALEDCVITAITKTAMLAALQREPKFSELFMSYLLKRNSRIEEDLDAESGRAVMSVLAQIAKDPARGVLVVTHDPRIVEFADRIVSIEDGCIISDSRAVGSEDVALQA